MYTLIQAKTTAIKLSDKVINILHEKGLSKVFNYNDYNYFKEQCKNAFDKANAIAELFIQDNNHENSDYHDYIY
jgi:hypothetical protein